MVVLRVNEIHRRRVRKHRVLQLRRRYLAAKTGADREKVLEKLGKVTPWTSAEGFIARCKNPEG